MAATGMSESCVCCELHESWPEDPHENMYEVAIHA